MIKQFKETCINYLLKDAINGIIFNITNGKANKTFEDSQTKEAFVVAKI